MASVFPAGIDTFSTKVDRGVVYHTDINNIQDAIVALETYVRLGGGRVVNVVTDGGAVGDDTADDTSAFQTSLNVITTSGGGILYVPVGTYKITTGLIVPSNTLIIGEGWNSVIKGYFGTSTGKWIFSAASIVTPADRTYNVWFENFRVQLGTSYYPNYAFHLSRFTNVVLDRIYMDGTDVPSNATTKRQVFIDCYGSNQHVWITRCDADCGGVFVRGAGATVYAGTITNATDNGSGKIRITSAAHGRVTGDSVHIEGIVGTTEANGDWDSITVIDENTYDLDLSVFANAYVSDGTWSERTFDVHVYHNSIRSIVDEPFTCWGWHGTVSDVYIEENYLEERNHAATGAGVAIYDADTASPDPAARTYRVHLINNTIRSRGYGIHLFGQHTSGEVRGLSIKGNTVECIPSSNTVAGLYESYANGAAASVKDAAIEGNIFVGYDYGVLGTTLKVKGGAIRNCGNASAGNPAAQTLGLEGVEITNSAGNAVQALAKGSYLNNHIDTTGTAGIRGATISDVRIAGNYITNTGTGIYITGTTGDSGAVVVYNDVSDSNTVPISIATHVPKAVRDNIGYVNAAKGAGTIASGATTAVVTHGLDYTPQVRDISVVFAEQGSNDYGRWWVSNPTSTQFTVNVSADPGASNLDFGWSVSEYP